MEHNHREVQRCGASALSGLRQGIAAWRSTCLGPQGRMPERLWREAVLLAGELGADRVASSLGLNRVALGRRLGRLAPIERSAGPATFVDVTAAFAPSTPLALEIVARDGTRLRFQGPLDEIRSLVLSVVREGP